MKQLLSIGLVAALCACSHDEPAATPAPAPMVKAPSNATAETPKAPTPSTPVASTPAPKADAPSAEPRSDDLPPPDVQVKKTGAHGVSAVTLEGVDIEWSDDLPEHKEGAGMGDTNATTIVLHGWVVRLHDGKLDVSGHDFGAAPRGAKVLLSAEGVRVDGELRGKLP